MPFPTFLKPLPSVFPTSSHYFHVIHLIQSVEECHLLRRALHEELGHSPKFFQLLFHVSKDILNFTLEHVQQPRCLGNEGRPISEEKRRKAMQFRDSVISMNGEQYQEILREKYTSLQPLRREMLKLI